MVSFSTLDIVIVLSVLLLSPLIGYLGGLRKSSSAVDFMLSGRNVGLTLFIVTNVATWYGGILGVGEFAYRYGLASWFTQGLPYYIFAFLFGLFLAKKIRLASLFTIPEKLEQVYGKQVGLLGAFLVFLLVNPAPYLLMLGNIISLVFDIHLLLSFFIIVIPITFYLIVGGYRSNLYADAYLFVIMFGGFILFVVILITTYGGFTFISNNAPASHLDVTGGASPIYILVWFLIALWTFADPGFHQRVYSAKSVTVAKKGIFISILFWIFFDFLTNSVGLFASAILPDLENPVLAYPLLAEEALSTGLKGIFYGALIATILSTLNSFLFLGGTTIGRDVIYTLSQSRNDKKIKAYSGYGIVLTSIVAIVLAYTIPSVIDLWYYVGTFCIPSLIFLIFGAYYKPFEISGKHAFAEMILAFIASLSWEIMRWNEILPDSLDMIEPMIIGLCIAGLYHLVILYHGLRIQSE